MLSIFTYLYNSKIHKLVMYSIFLGPLLLVHAHFTYGFPDYHVKVSNDGPVILGANLTFTAHLYKADNERPDGSYKYKWRDNLFPQHSSENDGNATSTWVVKYPYDDYHDHTGHHFVEVTVYEKLSIIDWPLCRARGSFVITELLNGNLELIQDNKTKPNDEIYVSNSSEVIHEVVLRAPDLKYIKQNASVINTYWFIDTKLVETSHNMSYRRKYTDVEASHDIDVFIVALNLPEQNGTSNATYEKSISPISSGLATNVANSSEFENCNDTSHMSFDCATKMIANIHNSSARGIFKKRIRVKAPIDNVSIGGNTWLKQGEVLNIQITCHGSAPYKYCYRMLKGDYNVTGNETCPFFDTLEHCNINITRYLMNSGHYSLLLIIHNDLNRDIRAIGIDIYEVTKHPQLSVIVVPVSATIVALVLIIIGIMYYFQNRHTFTVEVANFNFATSTYGMEYKTFRERLIDAIRAALDKNEEFDEQESPHGVPTNSSENGYDKLE